MIEAATDTSETDARRARTSLWTAVIALAVSCILTTMLTVVGVRLGTWRAILVGTLLARMTLVAYWAVLAPLSFRRRMAVSAIWLILEFAVRAAVVISQDPYFAPHALPQIAFFVPQPWLFGTAIASLLAIYLRWRLEAPGWFTPVTRFQFGIGQLMAVTTAVGVLFGLGRALIVMGNERFLNLSFTEFAVTAVRTAICVFITFPPLWALLRRKFSLLFVVVSLAPSMLTIMALQPFVGTFYLKYFHPLATVATIIAWIALIALILRAGGFRLTRG